MNELDRNGSYGVVVSLEDAGGEVRMVLDDVAKRRGSEAPVWDHKCLFTTVNFDKERFESLSLSTAEFAQIGENLVMRLLALGGRSR